MSSHLAGFAALRCKQCWESSDIGVSINTIARMAQHPKGRDCRDFIFTPIPAHGVNIVEKIKRKRDEGFQPIMSHRAS